MLVDSKSVEGLVFRARWSTEGGPRFAEWQSIEADEKASTPKAWSAWIEASEEDAEKWKTEAWDSLPDVPEDER